MKTRILSATILLLMVGIGWIIQRPTREVRNGTSGSPSVALEVQPKAIVVHRAGGHAQLILTAEFRQSGVAPVRLEPPLVALLTADEKPAARFLGPLLPEPVLAGSGPSDITLHYWIPIADLKGPVLLEAAGKRYPLTLPDVG